MSEVQVRYSLNGHYEVEIVLPEPFYPNGSTKARATGENFKEVSYAAVKQLLPEGMQPRLVNLQLHRLDVGQPLARPVDWGVSWSATLTEGQALYPGSTGSASDPDPNRSLIRALVESARVFLQKKGV